ncbi:MAG: efflux RND transporter periplasmic adaptor subunit [Pirellula sp.]|jgi:HlyD family secretion protein
MKRMIRNLPWIVGFVICVVVLTYMLWPSPIRVEVVQVTQGAMIVTIDEDGKTRVKERFIISAPIAGQLARIGLHAGDFVEANKTVIATIEPTKPALLDARSLAEAESRVKAAEAASLQAQSRLEAARETYALVKHDLDRVKGLSVPAVISQAEVDHAEHQERIAAATLRGAEFADRVTTFELEISKAAFVRTLPESDAQSNVTRMDILSPVNGQVFRVIQENATVTSPGQALVEIGNTQELEIVIDVLSMDAPRIKPGSKVIVIDSVAQTLEARVRLVEPSGFTKTSALGVEEQRVNVIADFVENLSNVNRLGDKYRMDARIVVWEATLATKVPAGALFRKGNEWAVFIVENQRARMQTVSIGEVNNLEAEVLSGLSPGDEVINYPSDKIRDGVRVFHEQSSDI